MYLVHLDISCRLRKLRRPSTAQHRRTVNGEALIQTAANLGAFGSVWELRGGGKKEKEEEEEGAGTADSCVIPD